MTETEQSCLIRSLLTKRDDAEAQKLLDRCLSIWKRAHGYQESFFRRRGRRIALLLSVGIGLAGCTVLSVPVFSKYYTMWQQEQHPVDPGYTLDGTGDFSEEDFESIEALKERYPTMQTPTFIPEAYTLNEIHVTRIPGSIDVYIGYKNQSEEYMNVSIVHSNSKLNISIEYDYGSQQHITEDGISYCFATNLDRNVAFWTVSENDFDKLYIVSLPQKAGDIKEIVFSFE